MADESMHKDLPFRNSAGLTRNLIDKRTMLRRAIRSLCDVSDFKLQSRSELTPDRIEHVQGMLGEVSLHLLELVQMKQSDRFFDGILAKAPERQHTVDQIMKDYQHLLTDLDQLKKKLDDAHRAPVVRRLLHGWLTRFLELDRRECTLLQEVWNGELGMMD